MIRPDFELAAARMRLGLARNDDLIGLATRALVEGHDSPSLRVLAGLTKAEATDAPAQFEKALGELTIPMPTMEAAGLHVARHYASEILEGRLTPYEGARLIWNDVYDQVPELRGLLARFVGFAGEWEDQPHSREYYDGAIEQESRRLLASSPGGSALSNHVGGA